MTELVRVDTKAISTADGLKTFNFLVIGDPCLHEEQLNKPYTDPFNGGQTTIAQDAPELTCSNGKLANAIFSDHGYVIMGMLFGPPTGASPQSAMLATLPAQEQVQTISQDPTWGFGKVCEERREQGYNSGMGKIFHKVAMISPISVASGVQQKFEVESAIATPVTKAKSDSSYFALKCTMGVALVIMGVGCIVAFRIRSKNKDEAHMSDAEMSSPE
jgi:hypothetical protein